ncbi:unnamed protein product [Enterobius vermicularis]|uniref:ANK_REP_REGION domain-containing protein n=1 Tax=Enterobius vermicularis TaxID=51028 RepID=A0A158QAE3_ENTVE|nr:unnamed protein product [Enterobius vermicularis]
MANTHRYPPCRESNALVLLRQWFVVVVSELEKQLSKAQQRGNDQLVSDLYVDLAEEHRRAGFLNEAIEAYKSSLIFSEKCCTIENAAFAHRAIAEMSVDCGIGDDCAALTHGEKYFNLAKKTGQVHLIQLAFHVYGWLQFQVYLNSGAKNQKLLLESKEWCEKGLAFLNKNAVAIDSDPKAVRIGQNSKARRARLRQVLSQICDKLGDSSQALSHHNAAFAYAVREEDFDLQYRCLLSKLYYVGNQRIKTAVDLVHVASNLGPKESADAKFILAQEKIRAMDFDGAKWDMISILCGKDFNALDNEEQSSLQQCLIVVYRAVERLRRVEKLSSFEQMKTYEKIADEFIDLDFREVSLEFYEKMLACAESKCDRIKAFVSIAETARELNDFEKAYQCYSVIESIENTLTLENKKRAETAICLLEVTTKLKTFPPLEVEELYLKAKKYAETHHQKLILREIYLEYLKKMEGMRPKIEKLKSELEVIRKERNDSPEMLSDTEEHDNEWADKFGDLSGSQILAQCEVEATRRNMEERIRQEKDKKINLYGETRMHEAARGNDLAYLRLLLKHGYSINAKDEGGWTPLHEAVGALKVENVRLLVEAGACLDIRSNEGTLSAEGERTDSGGLTPLMEACDRGSTAIANLLLSHGANIALRNKDNWTALDFFRNALAVGMVEEEDMSAANDLVVLMEARLRQVNAPVSKFPPPKKLTPLNSREKLSIGKESVQAVQKLSPERKNLLEYRKIMRHVGRGDVHERTGTIYAEVEDFTNEVGGSSSASVSDNFGSIFDSDSLCGLVDDSVGSFNESFSRVVKKKRRRSGSTGFSNSRIRRRKMVEELGSDSEEELLTVTNPLHSVQDNNFSRNTAATTDRTVNEDSIPPKVKTSEIVSTEAPSKPSDTQSLIFIKIVFKQTDGKRIKVKGIPFNRSAVVSAVRNRCLKEICSEDEVTSLSIRQGDCELSDETPIALVLDGLENTLDCFIEGTSKLSPSQTYLKKAKVKKSNIVRALDEARRGLLDLSYCFVEREGDALSSALMAFSLNSLSELVLSGNFLSEKFIKSVAYLARFLEVLKLESCGITNQTIEGLLGDRSSCTRLSHLDLSYNDVSNSFAANSLSSFLNVCPNLKRLNLSSCGLSAVALPCLLDVFKGLTLLEDLNISHNPSVDSSFVTKVTEICTQLSNLNISDTGFQQFTPDLKTCHLKSLSLYGCEITREFTSQSFLEHLEAFLFLDFSYTMICCSDLEAFMECKKSKLPILTLKLYGCLELEKNVSQLVELIHSRVNTDTALHLQLSEDFRERLLSTMSSSFSFLVS